mmetsp:Transcript_17589/g.52589  ORF Transcript_17589/g.52589 Transcript_17589/m.52589 type:complete len:167 (+) Transcript_17589:623-1123(+)
MRKAPTAAAAAAAAGAVVVEGCAIAMTRSLGDFYAHRFGVTHEPQVKVIELATLAARGWQRYSVLLASDGVWDLWGFDEVSELLLPRWKAESVDMTAASDFCERTREKGEAYFGEQADNLTGVFLDFTSAVEAVAENATAADVEATEESTEGEQPPHAGKTANYRL